MLNNLEQEQRANAQKLGTLDARITETKAVLRREVSDEVKKLATDGLRLQAAGLFLTLVGTVLAAIG
ncbi:MAG: hypothetical protein ACJ74U_13600 [Jatrophihabitantaceae bacterium]